MFATGGWALQCSVEYISGEQGTQMGGGDAAILSLQ
jgi:hypothetical protein